MTELSLWLDSYDDIYSDFDNRHYLKRRVSEDFLYELQKEMKFKKDSADSLVLLLPEKQRDATSEETITRSLNDFFCNQYEFHQKKRRQKFRHGIILLVTGIIIMLVNSWVNFRFAPAFHIVSLRLILEPAGWFLLWAGFDLLFYDFRVMKKDRDFFRKLCQMHIHFKST